MEELGERRGINKYDHSEFQSHGRKKFGERGTLWQSLPRFSQIESVPCHRVKEEKSERQGTWVRGAGGSPEGRAELERTWKAAAYLHRNECQGLTVPGYTSRPHPIPTAQGARRQWASQPMSYLSDEGMPDFPVIPLSRPKAFTHCSLLSIIALAWACGDRSRVTDWDIGPQSQSLHDIMSESPVSPAKREKP